MKNVNNSERTPGLRAAGRADADFLKTLSGREVRATVIRAAEPGQTALLRISGKIIQAAAENVTLHKGTVLYIKTLQSEGRYVMKILAKEEPLSQIPLTGTEKKNFSSVNKSPKKEIIRSNENREALERFFHPENPVRSFEKESAASLAEYRNPLSDQFSEILLSFLNSEDPSITGEMIEKTQPDSVFSSFFRLSLDSLGPVSGLVLSRKEDFSEASVLLLGSESLKRQTENAKKEWMQKFSKWNLNIKKLEVISFREQKDSSSLNFSITV